MRLDSMLLARWFIDVLLAVWFFRPISAEGEKCSFSHGMAGALCLLAILPIYIFIDLLSGNFTRFLYRAALYALYLHFTKRLEVKRCVYFALIGWLVFNIVSNAFLTPALRGFFFVAHLNEVSVGTLLCYLADFAVITLISRTIPFDHIQQPGQERFAFALFLCVVQIYIKSTLNYISVDPYTGPSELSAYLVLLQVLLAAAMVFFERYLYARQVREDERISNIAGNYRYESALAQHEAVESVRRLHHDMKNHLLAIQNLAHDDGRLGEYISGLVEDLSVYEHTAQTGNELLDGLLADKLRTCAKGEIDFVVELDFRPCVYMEDIDVCVIFGNILDNAIEAAGQVTDPQERSILLKGRQEANQYIITCSNYYAGDLRLSGELPSTTKRDKAHHGIGLSSVRRSVEKYGGVLSLRTTDDHRLILTILLPISAEA